MQNDDKYEWGKRPTSVEIVDVAPPNTDSDSLSKPDLLAGVTELSKDELSRLFQFRNLVYVGTLSKDGSPHITPVWAEMVEDLILINTFEESAKIRHVTKDKRIALSVVEQNNPFNMVSIKGRVVEQTTEGADEHLKKLAKRYLGIGKYYYRQPNNKRIILKIKPEKIMGLSIHPAFYFLAYSPWLK
ncbi:MAG TPA: pyridoxamine 5'-phosphate oxidase family protein [Nitrososphaeraceae archaeon]